MLILKIILIAICAAFASLILKSFKSEMSVFVLISAGILILLLTLSSLGGFFNEIQNVISQTGISNDVVKMIFKVVGVGLMCEVASNICSDVGAGNLAEYVLIGGRIAILVVCFPVIKNLISLVSGLV